MGISKLFVDSDGRSLVFLRFFKYFCRKRELRYGSVFEYHYFFNVLFCSFTMVFIALLNLGLGIFFLNNKIAFR